MAKIIGGIIVVVVVIGAVFVWQGKKAAAPMPDTAGEVMTGTEENMEDTGMNIVSSIKDAMGLGKTMQCTYAMDGGSAEQAITSTVVVKGEKFQSTSVMKDMTVYALFDGENQYTWMSNSKQGMKLSKACLEKMKETVKDMPTSNSPTPQAQDMQAAFDMAKDVQCKEGADLNLTLPTDITFVDQCAMMEQSMKMMEQMKQQMPENMTMPAMPN